MLIPWRVYIFSYPHVGSHVTPAGDKHTSSLFGLDLGEFAIGPTRVFCFGFGGGDLV